MANKHTRFRPPFRYARRYFRSVKCWNTRRAYCTEWHGSNCSLARLHVRPSKPTCFATSRANTATQRAANGSGLIGIVRHLIPENRCESERRSCGRNETARVFLFAFFPHVKSMGEILPNLKRPYLGNYWELSAKILEGPPESKMAPSLRIWR